MNPEIKQLWVDALRSGDYQQGEGALKSWTGWGDEFCCLGVLCELHRKSQPEGSRVEWEGPKLDSRSSSEYLRSGGVPPMEVRWWAGLNSYSPAVRLDRLNQTLADINDGGEADFLQIADLIEWHL